VLAPDLALSEQASVSVDQNGIGRCLQGSLVYEPDIAASPFLFPARLARGGLRALVITPLSVENKVFGVMITARRDPASFTSADCEFLHHLCEQLALAAHQAQLYTSLQQAYEDLRQTQETVVQQERFRALGQMASGIAHDINNSLSPAALYVESMLERERNLSKDARENLTVIQRAIDDVGRTVKRMRMLYRASETEITLSPVDLNTLLQQVVVLTRARWNDMPQKSGFVIDVKMDVTPALPPILGAENEIRDALTNLVLNAVDAMPEGGSLSIRSRALQPQTGRGGVMIAHVSVEICDTGIGMTESVRRRCFEPFFTTKGEQGTGLGLAMVYGMAQRHSADLVIESEPGQGTTVRLTFPTAVPAQSQQATAPARPQKPLRILLVDDDPLLLKSLENVLLSDGHLVVAADGGQAGIDRFFTARERGERFAAVVTDLGMPRVNGQIVAAAIKSAAPDTPVILLTGWGQRLEGDGELSRNVDQILSKPPRLAELRTALAQVADRDVSA
jgi:signal transduction histidine kinase/ActR/RegA family two-component response regulator